MIVQRKKKFVSEFSRRDVGVVQSYKSISYYYAGKTQSGRPGAADGDDQSAG